MWNGPMHNAERPGVARAPPADRAPGGHVSALPVCLEDAAQQLPLDYKWCHGGMD